jgi:hypothetical protein
MSLTLDSRLSRWKTPTVQKAPQPHGRAMRQDTENVGKIDERVGKGAESLASRTYCKRKPLRFLVCGARRSKLDAMSPGVSQYLHTPRRLLHIACGGKDPLLLPMVSTTLPGLRPFLGVNRVNFLDLYREYASAVKEEIVKVARRSVPLPRGRGVRQSFA